MILIVILMTSMCTVANAQNAEEVIKAELAFAKTANEQSTKIAFLSNLSSNSILYAQGEVVNGRESWEKREESNSLLAWWPVYADISLDGDLGYTTGPFQFYNVKGDQNPVGTGYYSTVWRKEDGVWRVMTDIGIGLREPGVFTHEVSIAQNKGHRQKGRNVLDGLISTDTKYIEKLNRENTSFDRQFLADEFRINRNVIGPVTSAAQLEKLVIPGQQFNFEYVGSGISASGDLGYTYGKVAVNKKEKPEEIRRLNYLRVWKRMGDEWKIVLDVIGG